MEVPPSAFHLYNGTLTRGMDVMAQMSSGYQDLRGLAGGSQLSLGSAWPRGKVWARELGSWLLACCEEGTSSAGVNGCGLEGCGCPAS